MFDIIFIMRIRTGLVCLMEKTNYVVLKNLRVIKLTENLNN